MKVQSFLMFEGKCEEAMNFYIARIPGSRIIDVLRYGKGQLGAEGSIMRATFCIGEQIVVCNDGPVKHSFTFTPSSLFLSSAKPMPRPIASQPLLAKAARRSCRLAHTDSAANSPGSTTDTVFRGK